MIPTAAGLAITATLALMNFGIGRSALYPPAHFCLIWSGLLTMALMSGSRFFALSIESILIYTVGALAFSVGGLACLAVQQHSTPAAATPQPRPDHRVLNAFLTVSLIVMIALFPLFWRYMVSIADPRFKNLWWGIRSGALALSELQGQKPLERIFYDNLTVASILLALTAMAYYRERGISSTVANGLVVMATLYNLATASRAGASTVVIGAVGIRMLKGRRISSRQVLAALLAISVMYVPITLLRNKGQDVASLAVDDLTAAGEIALLYTVGPLAAFDAYLQTPSAVTRSWSIFNFFFHAANRLGFDVAAPSTHLDFVAVSPTGATNVYTMYFAYYPDYGLIGVVALMVFLGYMLVWLYSWWLTSRRNFVLLLYGLAFEGMCRSGFSEGFLFGLNLWFKAGVVCFALYALERIAVSKSEVRGGAAQAEPQFAGGRT